MLNYRDASGAERELHFVVSGGGGAPLRDVPDEDSIARSLNYFSSYDLEIAHLSQKKMYQYCRVNITIDVLSIKVIEVDGSTENSTKLFEEISIRQN